MKRYHINHLRLLTARQMFAAQTKGKYAFRLRWSGPRIPLGKKLLVFVATAIGIVGGLLPVSVRAQEMQEISQLPSDCRSVLPPSMVGTVQSWQAFTKLEHCDRMKRLRRLSQALPFDQQPRFYETIVPAWRLPPEFGADMPVLRVVFPERSFFDTAEATLKPEADEIIGIMADSLRREPMDIALFVAGHTDKRGGESYNDALSIDRADGVARAIYRRGVNFSTIWRIGFGEDMPLFGGDTAADYGRNRRIEFLFASRPEVVAAWLADQQSGDLCQAANSREASACKAALQFRDDYIAERVTANEPKRPERRLSPAVKKKAPVNPKVKPKRTSQPTASRSVEIIPKGAQRIRIDPVNRRSIPVRVDL